MGELILVRHGETSWSRSGKHTSWTELPLTPLGEEQARSVAPVLAARRIALTLSSPLERAHRTAELAGLTPVFDDDGLHEWDYGGYEGITTVEIHRERPDWDLWTDGVAAGPPEHPGETPQEVGERADRVLKTVDAALRDADLDGEGGDVVLVGHAHFLRALTARRLGLPASAGSLFRLDTGSVSRIGTEHGHPVVSAWNLTGSTRD
ncbi:histidine phosphatase family protein [Streptomyces tsukubensis]|uniref:Histidine phosphatase family protein n=1 Tax=Streptomyces tsukubensis TaxID=83656 RepID=A0A1V4AEA2_9ACTN|nr:histidine phosphatase family protein [Streptomyces tsukubensis]OON82305.1 histidine phosphatase family protein [Streptomyces tsukubensis]QFR92794.1 histidine phosphatase family protein [Streptomyces tsukubensis]